MKLGFAPALRSHYFIAGILFWRPVIIPSAQAGRFRSIFIFAVTSTAGTCPTDAQHNCPLVRPINVRRDLVRQTACQSVNLTKQRDESCAVL